jgi:Fur family ferric uptake transcriptional regulator
MKMNFKVTNSYDYQKLQIFIREKGLKSSRKREFIIDYFLKQDKHFSAEELYNKIREKSPGIGYSTVYRTLKLLAECGLASIRHFEEGITRFEPIHQQEHHDHLICTGCKKIIEFKNKEIENLQKKIARKLQFSVQNHKLEIYGLCPRCAKKEKK